MIRRLTPLALALALLAGGATCASAASMSRALQRVLRLSDVPGYSIERTGPDPTCSAPVFVDEVRRDILHLLRRSCEVGLHDPALDVPVWWTGHDFRARGLRHVRLLSSVSAEPDARRYGARVTLTYGLNENWPAFQIALSHPYVLERRHTRRELRPMARDRCIRIERISVAVGTATLYARRRHCRTDAIELPLAVVRRPDVVLTVGCADCYAVQRHYPLRHYGSAAAVRAIMRALRPLGTAEPIAR